ncbi:hypothetical protein O1Q79_01667 [Lonepinella sp. MS14434]
MGDLCNKCIQKVPNLAKKSAVIFQRVFSSSLKTF